MHLASVQRCRLAHGPANQIVRQAMTPNLFLHHLRRLAAQVFHLHVDLEGAQIQLGFPVTMRPLRTVYLGIQIVESGDDPWLSYRRFVVGIVSSTGLLLSFQLCR